MPPPGEKRPFESTAAYYAEYRPGYGDAAVAYLAKRFGLDDDARVLDLGCGAGQVTLPLAQLAGEVVGMDPDEAMLREARERATAAGVENVEWVVGSDADLGPELGRFRLAAMGRSFHWMDRERTLSRLLDLTEPGGGVALLDDEEWLTRGTESWQAAVHGLAAEYLDDLPERTGPVTYDDPWDELLARSGFRDVAVATFDVEREWTPEEVVGYVFSLSFCSPAAFGEDRDAFERDLRRLLAERPEATFHQVVEVTVISGRTPADRGDAPSEGL